MHLHRTINYLFALNGTIVSRVSRYMWFCRLKYVSLLFLLRSASIQEEVIHEHKKGRILIQDTRPDVSGLLTGEQENLNFFNS